MPDRPVSGGLPTPGRSHGAKEIRPTRETRQLKAMPHRLLDIEGTEREHPSAQPSQRARGTSGLGPTSSQLEFLEQGQHNGVAGNQQTTTIK